MDNTNAVVNDLLNALDAIVRAASKNEPYATAFISGLAEQAIKNAHAKMVRNADGYLVVATSLDQRHAAARKNPPSCATRTAIMDATKESAK